MYLAVIDDGRYLFYILTLGQTFRIIVLKPFLRQNNLV